MWSISSEVKSWPVMLAPENPDSEMIGEGLFEVAEAVAKGTSPSKADLATQFQLLSGDEAPGRWARSVCRALLLPSLRSLLPSLLLSMV